ncbi:hypothetical protein Tco_0316429 [Tanacetum coccineum]
MSSITAQQTKLDLELVPKEKRLDIGKCNGRINPGNFQREPTFQVVLDALDLTLCYSAFLITADVPEVYMHQFWDYSHNIGKEVDELKKDPLHTQVTTLVDDHLDARIGATRDEFMNRLSSSITTRVTEQVKIQLP